MNSQKQSYNSNKSSSPESDHESKKSPEDNTGIGRSYECTYCKRGFTNAQALGGHMNIHRKDKAKAKQKNQEQPSINSIKINESYTNSRYFSSQITSNDHQQQQTSYYGAIGSAQMNYQVYLPSSNPNFDNFQMPGLYKDDHVDENLSLRIGLSPHVDVEEGNEETNSKENEVDLELRLGHDP